MATAVVVAWLFWVGGNGITWAGIALGLLGVLAGLGWGALRWRAGGRWLGAVAGGIVLVEAGYIAVRLRQTGARGAWSLCEGSVCGPEAPWLTRLVPEGETAMAGMALTSTLGMIREPEASELTRLLREGYGAMAEDRALAALPNAPLLGLLRGEGRYQLWLPPGVAHPPCVVFLHGFGGQLSVYLRALRDGGLGEEFALLAPLGGPGGWWWREGELERLDRLLAQLPPSIDRERLHLVGLSNGAIGATAIATSPRFAGKFRSVVALSGAGPVGEIPAGAPPVLLLTGRDDPRFPRAYIAEAHRRLLAGGVRTELVELPGDHFIVLSRAREVAERIRGWAR